MFEYTIHTQIPAPLMTVEKNLIDAGRLKTLSGSAVKVYLYLIRASSREAQTEPSLSQIAEATGLSISTVKRARSELVQQGLIRYTTGFDQGRPMYQLLPIPDAADADTPTAGG